MNEENTNNNIIEIMDLINQRQLRLIEIERETKTLEEQLVFLNEYYNKLIKEEEEQYTLKTIKNFSETIPRVNFFGLRK